MRHERGSEHARATAHALRGRTSRRHLRAPPVFVRCHQNDVSTQADIASPGCDASTATDGFGSSSTEAEAETDTETGAERGTEAGTEKARFLEQLQEQEHTLAAERASHAATQAQLALHRRVATEALQPVAELHAEIDSLRREPMWKALPRPLTRSRPEALSNSPASVDAPRQRQTKLGVASSLVLAGRYAIPALSLLI